MSGSGIYLVLFTVTMTYIVGYIGLAYSLSTLLLAGLSTIGIFSGLTLYAVQTRCDYTDKGWLFNRCFSRVYTIWIFYIIYSVSIYKYYLCFNGFSYLFFLYSV